MDLFSGIDFIPALQSQDGAVLIFMQIASLLGQTEVYLCILPAIYWLYDPRLGIRLALINSCSGWLNDILKQFLHLPRPYWISHDVRMLDLYPDISFGFPSGHSQIPVSFFGMIGYWVKSTGLWVLICILLLAIGLSRVFLGVHFPLDVIGGWSIGIAILLLFVLLDRPVSSIVRRMTRNQVIGMAFPASLFMACLSGLVSSAGDTISIPSSWLTHDHGIISISSLFSPSLSLITSGLFFGVITGWTCAREKPRYRAGGSWLNRFEIYVSGMAGLGLIYGILGLVIHFQSGDMALIFSWIRGALLGFWISFGAPFLFQKTGLALVDNVKIRTD
jgi:membrane-associated phospholipid phosphatase